MTSTLEAEKYFNNHVLPSYKDWLADELTEHKAMAIATNVCHMADHFWESYSSQPIKVFSQSTIKEYKHHLTMDSFDYSLIRDVCDAHKHCTLNRNSRNLTSSNQTGVDSMGWDEAKWDDAVWDKEEEIVIIDDEGEKHHFKAVIERTISYWRNKIQC